MDGEYSKLEKDFLGNERMVHYNSEGVAVSASRVERAEDGSMIVGEPMPLSAQPQPDPVPVQPIVTSTSPSYPPGTVATIGIASFVAAAVAALFIINSNRSDSAAERFNASVYRDPVQVQPRAENLEDVPPPQNFDSPRPRQEDEMFPPGDQSRPRIQFILTKVCKHKEEIDLEKVPSKNRNVAAPRSQKFQESRNTVAEFLEQQRLCFVRTRRNFFAASDMTKGNFTRVVKSLLKVPGQRKQRLITKILSNLYRK